MGVQAELMIQAAEQLKSEIIAYRRALHQQPEVGAYLPNTKEFVKKALSEMGYAPIEICESGIVATITGKNTGRCILLRADMDALAILRSCLWPWLKLAPSPSSMVSYPWGRRMIKEWADAVFAA